MKQCFLHILQCCICIVVSMGCGLKIKSYYLLLFQMCPLNLHSHLRVPVGSLSRFKLSLPQCNVPGVLNCMSGRLTGFPSLYWLLAMKIVSIDRTQRSIPVQTPSRKFRESLCSLPRKLTKVTLSRENNIFHIANFSATNSFLLCCINIIDYNRLTFDIREHLNR